MRSINAKSQTTPRY